MHIFSTAWPPKTGLLVGVVLGSALVYQIGSVLDHVTVRDAWQVQNEAAVTLALRRDQGLANTTQLLPPPGSTITANEIISWKPIVGASDYRVYVGTFKGGINLGHVNTGNETVAVLDAIPLNGEPVFVRISYMIDGVERHFDVSYVAEDSVSEHETIVQDNPFNPLSRKSVRK